jgi:hypothetical protein
MNPAGSWKLSAGSWKLEAGNRKVYDGRIASRREQQLTVKLAAGSW